MSLGTVVSKGYGKRSIERSGHGLALGSTQSRPCLIGVFPVRNLTDVLLLGYALSFHVDFSKLRTAVRQNP
jgi:hypothetical protein